MSNKQEQAMLIELDCLLDTRLATIRRLSKEAAVQVLQNGYHTRQADWFADVVDMDQYTRLYKARDIETLKLAQPTEGFRFVREMVKLFRENAVETNSPYSGKIKIVVNTYPYQLNAEMSEVIGRALAVKFKAMAPVELVHLSPAELTPALVRARFCMLMLYEYDPWMSLHYNVDPSKLTEDDMKRVLKSLLLDVTLFAPAVYYKKPPTQADVEQVMKDTHHPLEVIEMMGTTMIGLHLIDVTSFSVIRPARPQTPPTTTAAPSEPAVVVESIQDPMQD
jgi:hypothetical protein